MTITAPTLDQVLTLAQRLPRPARAELIARLALALVDEPPPPLAEPFPVITSGTWSDAIPLRREELYDDDGRA